MQPGQTITPGQLPEQETPSTQQAPTPEVTQSPPEEAQPTLAAIEAKIAAETPVSTFNQNDSRLPAEIPSSEAVQWTASEYIDHAKGPAWFALMGLVLFGVVALVYFILKDIFTATLLGLAGVTFGIFAGRRPQVLQYSISPQGISIGQRRHAFEDFKSFSLTESGPLPAILLLPLKRFLPPITIFYDPKEEDKIIEALANYLPHEEREPDAVDRLMSKIRF